MFAERCLSTTVMLVCSSGDSADDERCVAAWWLYRVTKEQKYYQDGLAYKNVEFGGDFVLTWNKRHVLCQVGTSVEFHLINHDG